ncbi:DNA glycosylase [Conidiobolus coronatus NRRL 28638]|uniref:DNA glycosylase n=1 Tax=Conidiobolus coronatus (strain ATCC 28846 / CBS 209.66 / NRRL 28638) TaxID=796925 RepID=A0A137P2D9_CONC2|nr:DNA glycosylase [Conidiobolus coronatus NRRL 28638]|eukprot:KXN69197.1 DNA glycosylase [Conidiobolus coronatus NRRL 28638]
MKNSTQTSALRRPSRILNKTGFKVQDKPKKTINQKVIHRDLPLLPDRLNQSMKILFIGINPGVLSSQKGRHFSNPRNLFWSLLFESGLISSKLTCEDDERILEEYGYGLTNLCVRPTVSMSDLSKDELRNGVPILKQKIIEYKPQVCCFLGYAVYRYFIKDMKKSIVPGFQFDFENKTLGCKMFAAPSTSGIATGFTKKDRLKCMAELNNWVKKNCK